MADSPSRQSTMYDAPDLTPEEVVVLYRAMAGVHLDNDAHLRLDLLRKLARSLKSAGIPHVEGARSHAF